MKRSETNILTYFSNFFFNAFAMSPVAITAKRRSNVSLYLNRECLKYGKNLSIRTSNPSFWSF